MMKYLPVLAALTITTIAQASSPTNNAVSRQDIIGKWTVVKMIDENGHETEPIDTQVVTYQGDTWIGSVETFARDGLLKKQASYLPFAYNLVDSTLRVEHVEFGVVTLSTNRFTNDFIWTHLTFKVEKEDDTLRLQTLDRWMEGAGVKMTTGSGSIQILKRR